MAEKNIGGRTFRVQPVLATQAILLQARLLKVVGPALSKLTVILDRGNADRSNTAAVDALTSIFSQSEPETVAVLIKDLVELAELRRPSGVYSHVDLDGDMSQYAKDIYPLLAFVLKEQFGSFFAGVPVFGSQPTQDSN